MMTKISRDYSDKKEERDINRLVSLIFETSIIYVLNSLEKKDEPQRNSSDEDTGQSHKHSSRKHRSRSPLDRDKKHSKKKKLSKEKPIEKKYLFLFAIVVIHLL